VLLKKEADFMFKSQIHRKLNVFFRQ